MADETKDTAAAAGDAKTLATVGTGVVRAPEKRAGGFQPSSHKCAVPTLTEAIEHKWPNGSVFACTETIERDGKQVECGKEYKLHLPTDGEWKLIRPRAATDANGTATTPAAAAAEPTKTAAKK